MIGRVGIGMVWNAQVEYEYVEVDRIAWRRFRVKGMNAKVIWVVGYEYDPSGSTRSSVVEMSRQCRLNRPRVPIG